MSKKVVGVRKRKPTKREANRVPELRIESAPLSKLHAHPRNYREHPGDQVEHIIASIKERGFYRPIVVAKDYTILAGHGVALASKKLGKRNVPIVRLPMGPNDRRALKVLAGDNEISKLADEDDRALTELLKEIMADDVSNLLGTGYDASQMAALAFVTRRELKNIQEANEWAGLPEYDSGEEPLKVVVSLRNDEDRTKFLSTLGLELPDGAISTWWPHRPRDDATSIKFVSDIMPRYPIYIPSKNRSDKCLTARYLARDNVPFRLVVEPQELETYSQVFPKDQLLVLPQNGGYVHYVRNWIKAHATKEGHAWHWQLDDNMRGFYRRFRGYRLPCSAGVAMAIAEDFAERYTNVAIAGLNYHMFVARGFGRRGKPGEENGGMPPFYLNNHVYSCFMVRNSLPYLWRLRRNDDTDYCLQALSDNWCTILLNSFAVQKVATMTMTGGQGALYDGDGRLKMSKGLERLWPGVVKTRRKWNRPQHHIADNWRGFNTPLKRRKGFSPEGLEPNEYGMQLQQVKQRVRSQALRDLLEELGPR